MSKRYDKWTGSTERLAQQLRCVRDNACTSRATEEEYLQLLGAGYIRINRRTTWLDITEKGRGALWAATHPVPHESTD